MDREVVKELIQNKLTVENLVTELSFILTNKEKIRAIKKDYQELRNLLEQGGNASEKAARLIVDFTSPTSS